MSELKGQILGVVLVVIIFGILALSFKDLFGELTELISEDIFGAITEAKSVLVHAKKLF